MVYESFVTNNEDGSKTYVTIVKRPGFSLKKSETYYGYDDDEIEDPSDRITIKKVDKCKKRDCDACDLEDCLKTLKDISKEETNDELAKLTDMYSLDDLKGLCANLPKILKDPAYLCRVIGVLMDIYKTEFKEE